MTKSQKHNGGSMHTVYRVLPIMNKYIQSNRDIANLNALRKWKDVKPRQACVWIPWQTQNQQEMFKKKQQTNQQVQFKDYSKK